MVDSIETKEKRIEVISALMEAENSLSIKYAGKDYMLSTGDSNTGSTFVLHVGGDFMQAEKSGEEENARLFTMPDATVHLDGCLNILSTDGYAGKPIAVSQQTVDDIMDRMIKDTAERQLRGGK